MAHSTQRPPVDFSPTVRPRQFRSLDEQVEAIVAVLPEIVPGALKKHVPSARDGAAEVFIADLAARLRALCPVRAQA
ncbi:hypothetical protein [Streptomyces longwoodensis]|uniref:hypothetical protein n=1 Tax=Streptomyces longwoodensis TaxID=68231 RepID=UPI0033E3C2C2